MNFKDHFSGHSVDYARYRPVYPTELFDWLAANAPRRGVALDCATGNGQAAIGLAAHFDRVIATDASAAQIAQAESHPKIEYRCAPAEGSGLESASVDLITAAQAYHWFDHDRFHAETRRLLSPGGLLAVWCYDLLEISPAVDTLVREYYSNTVGPYWPPERRLVETGYRTLPFPFAEMSAPVFKMRAEWTLADLLGFLRTWSATQRCIKETGRDSLDPLRGRMEQAWGDAAEAKPVAWPLALRAGS